MTGQRLGAYRSGIPAALLVVGILSTALLFWAFRIIARQIVDFERTHAIADLEARTAEFHLWFEEAIAQGTRDDISKTFPDLESATKLSDALLHGGESERGTTLPPLDAPRQRELAERIRSLLADLREIAFQRYADPAAAGIGSPLDERFDAVFNEIMETARALGVLEKTTVAKDHAWTRRMLLAVLLGWTSVGAATTWVFCGRELRRRRAEEALRTSEEDLARAQAVARTGSWRLNVRTNLLSWSDETYRIFGVPRGTSLSYEVFLASVHPDDRERVDRAWKAALMGAPYDIEHRVGAGEEEKWIRERAELEFDPQGNLLGGFGTAQDVTERRQAKSALERAYREMERMVAERTSELEEANLQLRVEVDERRKALESLKESESGFHRLFLQFRTLLDAIPDCITLVSSDLKVLWANRGASDLSREAGRNPRDEFCYTLWHNQSTACPDCPAIASFASGKAERAIVISSDGRHWEVRTVPVLDENGATENVLEVATDITEKVFRQAETIRTAHLASIGELAAGVAHEINNPINGIINYAQILHNKGSEGSAERRFASRILKEGERIGIIVRGLLSFARESEEAKRNVRPEQILSDALSLTRSQMKKEGIDLRVELPCDLPAVLADPRRIQQVFMNILSNARYALNRKYPGADENKVIEIRGEQVLRSAVPYVRISFRDGGIGIPAQFERKVMEPFFTTKPGGEGTGLGLSISHGIVASHGGTLSLRSVEGEFTEVVVDLPAEGNGDGEDPGR